MRQKRAAIVEECRGILEAAESAGRALTVQERRAYDEKIATAKSMAEDIARIEGQHAIERELRQSLDTPPGQAIGGEHRDLRDGEVRGFRHGQCIAETVRSESPDGQELEGWSLRKYLRGCVTGQWEGADIERRTHLEGTAATGGVFVPATVGANIIDLARNESRLSQAGMITIPMATPKMIIGKVVSDPTPYWRGEGQTITESDASYAGATLEAKTIAILTSCSVELLEDATGFTSTIEQQLAAAIALEIDRVGLFGNGVQEPLGIYNAAGVQEVSLGANGAVPANVDAFSQACENILLANGVPTAAIYSPRTWGTIDRMLDGEGRPLAHPESYKSLKKLTTNQVPVNLTQGTSDEASAAFVGGFDNVLMGVRSNLQIEASRVAGTDAFAKMKVMIRAYARVDFLVARATHLCKIIGILA